MSRAHAAGFRAIRNSQMQSGRGWANYNAYPDRRVVVQQHDPEGGRGEVGPGRGGLTATLAD